MRKIFLRHDNFSSSSLLFSCSSLLLHLLVSLLLRLCLLFRGASQSGNSSDVVAQLEQLKCRLVELEEEEKRLEEQYVRMKQCLRNLSEDTADNQYPSLCLEQGWAGLD